MSTEVQKKTATKAKKPVKPSVHPPVATMVQAAITTLKDKKGSSLAAIKKYIEANYQGIDMVKLAPFIRRFLKKAVTEGTLATAKGHAGSFKLGEKAKKEPKKEKKPKKAAAKPKKTQTPKKTAKPKKTKTPKKAAKKPAAAKPKKVKTPKKTKAAKPKKTKTPKKPAAKKPAKSKK